MSTQPLRLAPPTPVPSPAPGVPLAPALPPGRGSAAALATLTESAPTAGAHPTGAPVHDEPKPVAVEAAVTRAEADGPSDESLMARVTANADESAFDQIYRRFRRPLAAYLWRLAGGDGRAAEEMVQETLERVYRGRSGYDPNRRFRPWLFTIATNVARDRARRAAAARESHADVELWLANVPAPASDSPEAALRGRRLMVAAERAILALPELERTAFLLVRRAGLDYREGAAASGCSLPAFKMRVSRALERLAVALEPWLEGGRP